ncbi:MAG TPA: hypothetical protein DEA97_10350, partial [Bacteroidales bacterium]|nr:hypothetical protein [Bacteroidales bacterium]
SSQVSCYNAADGEVVVSATGGTGDYSYSLNGGAAQSSNVFSGLAAGSYTEVVSDINGCLVETGAINIINPEPLVLVAEGITNVSCFGSIDGSIIVNVTGGTGEYSYSLNGGMAQSSNVFSGLASGEYGIYVSDINGCSALTTVEILGPDAITVSYDNYCHSGIVGIEIIANGGTPPYLYSIDGGLSFHLSGIFDTLPISTNITVVVTDLNRCSSNPFDIPVVSLNTLEAEAIIINENSCFGHSDAVVEINTWGGEAPYYYSLNGGDMITDNLMSGLAAGEYTVTLQDANGCPANADFTIDSREPVEIELLSKINADCSGKKGGAVELSINGGSGPYTYNWSNGSDEQSPEDLSAGIHTVTVSDMNNCEARQEVVIEAEEASDIPVATNSFSPNGDGINDYWVIGNLELYPDNELVIINRWGNEVLTVSNYRNDWDGSDLGEGTYFYILKVKVCDEDKILDGYVTILR